MKRRFCGRKFGRKFCGALLAWALAVTAVLAPCAGAAGDGGDSGEGEPAYTVTDIEKSWARPAIEYCLEHGYMQGSSETTFDPKGTMTRGQLVQILYNMQEQPDAGQLSCPFEDIEDHWARDAVVWAYNSGIVNGVSATAFAPDMTLARQQAAAMLKSYHEYLTGKEIKTEEDYLWRYGDRRSISSWAKEGVSWVSQYNVMNGTSRAVFDPRKSCSRAEMAQIIQNYTTSRTLFPPEGPDGPEGPAELIPVADPPNSPLVSYVRLSPNHSGRRVHKIDTITIHCMAGDMSVEGCGALFANPDYEASSNYGIGSDGRIALYVDERNRSWCSSNYANDQRAVTIEVANNGGGPLWPVSSKAYNALIDLVTDICRRNGIERLLWRGDRNLIGQVDKQNMTVHRWFDAKSCPGDYLYNRHGDIAAKVNRRLTAIKAAESIEMGTPAILTQRSESYAHK